MRQPFHPTNSAPGMSPERLVGIGFVALLHVLAIWALMSGLAMKIVKAVVPPDITLIDITPKKDPVIPVHPPKPTLPTLSTDNTIPVKAPVFTIERDPPLTAHSDGPPQQVTPQGPPDTAASGVAGTHTIPDYPAFARRLGEQGSVTLRLTISPQGIVTSADIERSSGFADLDQTAVGWVLTHWKYKPAIQGGAPVVSQTSAVVVFSLKDARR